MANFSHGVGGDFPVLAHWCDERFSTVEGWSNHGDGVGYNHELQATGARRIGRSEHVVTVIANRGRQKFSTAGVNSYFTAFYNNSLGFTVTYELTSLVCLGPFAMCRLRAPPSSSCSHWSHEWETDWCVHLFKSFTFFLMISAKNLNCSDTSVPTI